MIPHRIHHLLSDQVGDPYGPHLGRFGSYLATESQQKMNLSITPEEYAALLATLEHICLPVNSYEEFKKTGSIECVWHYLLRTTFSHCFFATIAFFIGGITFLMAWYAGLFFYTFLLRDFNWWGHGGDFRCEKKQGWEFHEKSRALNQHFYGFIAGEWHDNHHSYPLSANTGFLRGQIDVAFYIIKILAFFGIVKSYEDHQLSFTRKLENVQGR